MSRKIRTYETLKQLIERDPKEHLNKDMARLLASAVLDCPTESQDIFKCLEDLEFYFGKPITIEGIAHPKRKLGKHWAWWLEAGSSMSRMIELSTKYQDVSDFDTIVEQCLNYYEQEFKFYDIN